MAVADAGGRCGWRRAAVVLLALVLGSGCSLIAGRDESEPGSAGATEAAAGTEVPPPPPPPPGSAPAQAATRPAERPANAATRIERVSIESAPPTTRVVLKLDGAAEPEVSLLVNQRLVIDVPGTTCASLPRVVEAGDDPLVERVRTGQHAAPEVKSRVVIDLRRRADFSVRAQGDRIVAFLAPADAADAAAPSGDGEPGRVLFGAEAAAGTTSAATAAATSPEPAPTAPVVAPPVERPPPAEPLVEATPAPAAAAATLAAPPAETPLLERVVPTPAPELTTPVSSVTVEGTSAEPPAAAPPSPDATAPPAPFVEATPAAASKRISIDFTEADVRTVIDLIATAGGYQVIFTPEVGGVVTITLVDRPWEEALATVLRAKRLREVRHEDVILVSPIGHATSGKHE